MEITKENAIKVDKYAGDLDIAIEFLAALKEKGYNAYIEFNGQKLYSMFDDENSCYKKVTGYNNKKECDEAFAKWFKEQKDREQREKEEALSKRDEYISRGFAIIPEDKKEEWVRCVDIRINDIYNGTDLANALEIMETLAKNEPNATKDAAKLLNDANHSGCSYGIVISIIKHFSENGEKFYNSLKENEITK